MPVALDPPQARFDVQQRRGHPPLLLVTAPPVIDLVRPLADLGHDRLQTVGGLQAAAEELKGEASRSEARFKESMEAEKEKARLLERKFKELLKKAEDEPITRMPRDIDLD